MWKNSPSHITGIVMTIKLWLIHSCWCECPSQWPLPNVMHCLYNVTNGVNGTNVLAGTDTNTVRMFCENGTFNSSIECLDNLYNSCGRTLIVPFTEPNEWKNAVTTLCSKTLQDHALYSNCIVEQRSKVKKCLAYNDMMFENSIKEHETDLHTLRIKICSYFRGIKLCSSDPIKQNCNVDIGQKIGDFLSSIIPKLCQPGYVLLRTTTSSSTHLHSVNSILYFITLLLYFISLLPYC
ncbi:hypothetical protein ACF0H5_014143 [Mactra antiquata]